MPKRAVTPPPGDDEPKYLTICYPYPPHANMELPGDRFALARWLACCMTTSDDLYAIFHKPSAPNMIVIEVRKDYPGFRRLLGAHKWSDFVKSPGEHRDKITRIYFSTFPSGRAVEKAGWKRIFVGDDWFQDFSPNNKYIAYPYPITSYCDPLSEAQMGFTLCRPIPRELFAVRLPTPPPVPVGSASWIAQKDVYESQRSYAIASAAYAKKGIILPSAFLELQMPVPSMATNDHLSPGSSGAYGNANSLGYPSSSSVSYHSSSPVSRPHSWAKTGGSSGYNSEASFPGGYDSPGSGSVTEGNNPVACGKFDVQSVEDNFGTLSLHPTTNEDGTPICPSHGLVCKKGICRDYSNLLRKIENDKKAASQSNNWRSRGRARGTKSNGSSAVTRGRGRGSDRARGSKPTRGRGSKRGTLKAFAGESKW